MQSLAVEWSGARFALEWVHRDSASRESFLQTHYVPLIQGFIDGSLVPQLRSISSVNAEWREFIEQALAARTNTSTETLNSEDGECMMVFEQPPQLVWGGSRRNRRLPGVDPRLLMRAFEWLLEPSLWSDQPNGSLQYLLGLLSVSLETMPEILAEGETDPLPMQYDQWVFRLIGVALPRLSVTEQRTSLWHPILDRVYTDQT
jgi:hypothetical protein